MTPGADSRDVLVGVAFMCLGAALLPFMHTFAKSLVAEYPLWPVVWARFLGHLIWVSILFAPALGRSLFMSRRPWQQMGRSGIFFVSNAAFISALPFTPLATASSIMFTTPLVVTLLAIPLLGERVGRWRVGACVLGFVGALIIIRPGTEMFNAGSALVALSAGCFGLYQLWTRMLSKVERSETQVVYMALVGAIGASLLVPFVWETPHSWSHIGAFCAVGLVGGIAQFCVIQALQRGPASVISPIGYVELPSAVAFGYAVFGDFPDQATWIGAALIIAAGLTLAYRESRAAQ